MQQLLPSKDQWHRSVALESAIEQYWRIAWAIDFDRLPRASLKLRDEAPEQPPGYALSLRGREQATLSPVVLLGRKCWLPPSFWSKSPIGNWNICDPRPECKFTHGLQTAGYGSSGPSGEAVWEQPQCVYLACRSAKVEDQVDTTGKASQVCGGFYEVQNIMADRVEAHGISNGSALYTTPTPGIHLPAEGSGMPLIATLTRPKRFNLDSKCPHATSLEHKLDFKALEVGKLFLITLNDLCMSRSRRNRRFGSGGLETPFFPVNQLEENGYEGSRHLEDATAPCTEDGAGIRAFAKVCISVYNFLKKKTGAFGFDAEPLELLGAYVREKIQQLKWPELPEARRTCRYVL